MSECVCVCARACDANREQHCFFVFFGLKLLLFCLVMIRRQTKYKHKRKHTDQFSIRRNILLKKTNCTHRVNGIQLQLPSYHTQSEGGKSIFRPHFHITPACHPLPTSLLCFFFFSLSCEPKKKNDSPVVRGSIKGLSPFHKARC